MNQVSDEGVAAERRSAKYWKHGMLLTFAVILVCWGVMKLFPYFGGRIDPNQKPDLSDLNPEFVVVDLTVLGESPVTFTVSNTTGLMSLLRAGQHVQNHKCTYRGKLTLHYSNGTNVSVPIRPGHTNTVYEFSYGGIFQIPRPAFLSILSSGGVDTNLLPVK